MKARFKTILLSALGALSVFSAVTVSSCNEDKCKAIVCAFGGVCTDGACLCPSGYEGPQCETVNRQRYLGAWVVTENGSVTDAAQYTLSIEKGDNITELRIKNLRNLFITDVRGFVNGDTLYIPQQTIDNHTVIGSGYITSDKFYGDYGKLVVTYKVTDNNGMVDDFGVDGGDPSLWNK
ncbi:MAG: hypothetical protein EOP49_06625 [Sphingobacteriales bacterium]|nr:MAG: hypothetical protein EOP49_06625 [Sphingobacteriales bacterium]